jgi:hypothetical protein
MQNIVENGRHLLVAGSAVQTVIGGVMEVNVFSISKPSDLSTITTFFAVSALPYRCSILSLCPLFRLRPQVDLQPLKKKVIHP